MSDGITFGSGGIPVRIESFASMDEKRRYRIVRADNFDPVPGQIISANAETGECVMSLTVPGQDEPKIETLSFGQDGLRIISRK